jgi:hypothetical protein
LVVDFIHRSFDYARAAAETVRDAEQKKVKREQG